MPADALDKRIICDMYEGNRPYTARYVLPDYTLAMRQGSRHLELDPPTDVDEALSFLTILYAHVPSVTTYPVYLGDLDALLEPFVDGIDDDVLDRKLRLFWRQLDRLLPDAFVHTNVGPSDGRVVRSILRVERSLRQVVPNITLKVDPADHARQPDRRRGAHRVRDRQAAFREPPDDGGRPRRPLRRGQLLQLAEDRWRRAHPGPAEPQGAGPAAPRLAR
ncbi:MAG: glycyl radical enzyme domain-containing protein [Ilumatobacteraceae bacterium]